MYPNTAQSSMSAEQQRAEWTAAKQSAVLGGAIGVSAAKHTPEVERELLALGSAMENLLGAVHCLQARLSPVLFSESPAASVEHMNEPTGSAVGGLIQVQRNAVNNAARLVRELEARLAV